VKLALLDARDQSAAARPDLVGIRPRLGVHQRQLRHPVRRLPHDLERDVAAHRVPGQREPRRPLGEDTAGDHRHVVVADVIGDGDRPVAPQGVRHRRVDAWRAAEPGNQQNRHRIDQICPRIVRKLL